MDLAAHTWTDVEAYDADVALLPVGSTEQHGPHAPLGTDHLAAAAVADAAAEAYDGEVLVAPTIPVGVSEEHRAFAGTLWVREDTFRAYVHDVVTSLAHHGVDRVVVVNGHGGNVAALREVCGRLSRDEVAYTLPFTWFDSVASDLPMGHAGARETALLRHVAPDLVREGRLEEAREHAAERWGEWVAGVDLAYDSDEFAENGVVGDPTAGDAEAGEALLAGAATALRELVTVVEER
ncbi:creatininase family protein [Halomarina oriensis]|uniref:Creatininase family protein n=1 Tax=Halomarina oriensis TaxID=671145 RepID=A0A6B0GG44_9EURY|nr:creatininase family protein [Halomarina oriensis]MWG32997.1 creatininase family protein [Halomarina oriensis]